MARQDFQLTNEPGAAFADLPTPTLVRVPLSGCTPCVELDALIPAGSPVGEPLSPLGAWVHTPISGKVVEIDAHQVSIQAEGKQCVEPLDTNVLNGPGLEATLARHGVDVSRLTPARLLIVNASPPEPGPGCTNRLLSDFRDTLARGLNLARTLVAPTNVTVCGPDVDASAFGNCDVKRIKPSYPFNLEPLLIKAVTGHEHSSGVTVVDLFQLMGLGRIQETGLPVTESYLCVQGQNYRALVGTPLHNLLEAAGTTPVKRDRVILGGPMRGEALCDLSLGLGKNDYGLFVIPEGEHPPVKDAPCINCGACVAVCPARIAPGELSMCAEKGLWARAREGGVEACFECGLCGYHCPTRRPLLQYLRLAKNELAQLDAAAQGAE
ncbi:MAG: 4Fe-4S dicluster domain-containing protein [Desulfovibrionaceae bacterium]